MIGFPEGERPATRTVVSSLWRLRKYFDDFKAAVSLFDACAFNESQDPTNQRYGEWQHIAARDGAMTLYHIDRILFQTGRSFKESPTLLSRVDRAALRKARRLFAEHFSETKQMRHAVAHSAEMAETQDNVEKNAFSGSFSGHSTAIHGGQRLTISDVLMGRSYTTTHEGKFIQYELSENSLALLHVIVSKFFGAFNEADKIPT